VTLGQAPRTRAASATPLSRRSALIDKAAPVLGLARLSLLSGLSMLLTSSCIVADPPEYLDPVQTRPVLDIGQADPGTSQVLLVQTGEKVTFSVPVRSEDAGEDLRAVFFVDQGPGSPGIFQNSQSIPASTYNDTSRPVTFEWTVPPSPPPGPGCHLMTLTVAHRLSFDPTHDDVLNPKDQDDAAIVNWWLNVNPTTDPSTLVNCPTKGVVAQ
jgi:hypothetical protein